MKKNNLHFINKIQLGGKSAQKIKKLIDEIKKIDKKLIVIGKEWNSEVKIQGGFVVDVEPGDDKANLIIAFNKANQKFNEVKGEKMKSLIMETIDKEDLQELFKSLI